MKKSKVIGATIVCAAALSLVFLAAGYIIDKSSPHYTVDYGDSQVTISVMKKEGADRYYTFTTNHPQAFEVEHYCGQQIPHYFIKQSAYTYTLKVNEQHIQEDDRLYLAKWNNNQVESVVAYTPFFVNGALQGFEPCQSEDFIGEYRQYAHHYEELINRYDSKNM